MKKIGIAGVSHIHMPNFATRLKARPGIEVVAVWEPAPEQAAKYAKEFGCGTVATVESLWKDAGAEAVVVCSETNLHREIVPVAAAAGMDLFVEKPLGFSAADALEMAAAVEKAGVLFQTGYFMRGAPVHRALKRIC